MFDNEVQIAEAKAQLAVTTMEIDKTLDDIDALAARWQSQESGE
jgi:hypothetical protein